MTETDLPQGHRTGKRPRCADCRWWLGNAYLKRSPWLVAGQVTGGHGHEGIWPEVPADSWCDDFGYRQEV